MENQNQTTTPIKQMKPDNPIDTIHLDKPWQNKAVIYSGIGLIALIILVAVGYFAIIDSQLNNHYKGDPPNSSNKVILCDQNVDLINRLLLNGVDFTLTFLAIAETHEDFVCPISGAYPVDYPARLAFEIESLSNGIFSVVLKINNIINGEYRIDTKENYISKVSVFDGPSDSDSKLPFPPPVSTSVENWQTYHNDQYQFQLKYPPDWNLSTNVSREKGEPEVLSTFQLTRRGCEIGLVRSGGMGLGDNWVLDDISIVIGGRNFQSRQFYYEDRDHMRSISVYNFPKIGIDLTLRAYRSSTDDIAPDCLADFYKILSTLNFLDEPTADVSSWQIYRNEKYRFEFKYPAEFNKVLEDYGSWRNAGSDVLMFGMSSSSVQRKGVDFEGFEHTYFPQIDFAVYPATEYEKQQFPSAGFGFNAIERECVLYEYRYDLKINGFYKKSERTNPWQFELGNQTICFFTVSDFTSVIIYYIPGNNIIVEFNFNLSLDETKAKSLNEEVLSTFRFFDPVPSLKSAM